MEDMCIIEAWLSEPESMVEQDKRASDDCAATVIERVESQAWRGYSWQYEVN